MTFPTVPQRPPHAPPRTSLGKFPIREFRRDAGSVSPDRTGGPHRGQRSSDRRERAPARNSPRKMIHECSPRRGQALHCRQLRRDPRGTHRGRIVSATKKGKLHRRGVRAHAGVSETRRRAGTLAARRSDRNALGQCRRRLPASASSPRKFYRVGANIEYKLRRGGWIAATNRCPLTAVQAGSAARRICSTGLAVFPIDMPPLRNNRGDD